MARLNKKIISSFPKNTNDLQDRELITWFSQLALFIADIRSFTAAVNLPLIAATSYATVSVTVPGILTTDVVMVNPPALTAGLIFISARVTGADSIDLVFYNSTGGGIDEASSTYSFIAIAR